MLLFELWSINVHAPLQVANFIQGTIDSGDGFIGPYGVAAAAGEYLCVVPVQTNSVPLETIEFYINWPHV